MKVLLDTNIIIHRESHRVVNNNIGMLFYWLDKLKYAKYIHPLTIEELNRYKDSGTVTTMNVKAESYNVLKSEAPMSSAIVSVSDEYDRNDNDRGDTKILNEVYSERMDILISEDNKIHKKAEVLGIKNKVYRIDDYLSKLIKENPELVNYKVLAVKKLPFGKVDITDEFFDSFREDYIEFNKWFNKKSEEICYVCYEKETLAAFLYIKVEKDDENYFEIEPRFEPKKRLKIGTFKVTSNGFKIGERFLKIIFDNAAVNKVDEIYVTIFNKRSEQNLLIKLLEGWGFVFHGIKHTQNGDENVYVRPFGKTLPANILQPKFTYPYFSAETNKYIIKIEPNYHKELFPDSINTRESPLSEDNEPHRNSISKAYISHSPDRFLKSGDIVIIYRMGETSPKLYSSTVTTICIVESIVTSIKTFEELKSICRKRTVIDDQELKDRFWNKSKYNRPFVINMLYAHSFPTPKPTLEDLNKLGIIPDIKNIPRGFIKISDEQFNSLVNFAYKR